MGITSKYFNDQIKKQDLEINLNTNSYTKIKHEAIEILKVTMSLLYPSYYNYKVIMNHTSSEENKENIEVIKEKITMLLNQLDYSHESIDFIVEDFLKSLIAIKGLLNKDLTYFLQSDPACSSVEEVILCYPGFYAITAYRISNILYHQSVPLLPRILSEYAHSKTGIDIHPGAQIGEYFFIDHGTGVVIGETAVIGKYVKIYQGVTLGAISVEQKNIASSAIKRHPTIEDHVTIYAGATILGGKTVIGRGSILGGNTWVTKSIPSFSKVIHNPSIQIKLPLADTLKFEL